MQGVNEFVLDLRYNGGGYLISANVLASLLVPEKNQNDIFSIDTDNKGRQSKRYFSSEGANDTFEYRSPVCTNESFNSFGFGGGY